MNEMEKLLKVVNEIQFKAIRQETKRWNEKIKDKIEELKEIADEDNMEAYIKIQVLQELMEEK